MFNFKLNFNTNRNFQLTASLVALLALGPFGIEAHAAPAESSKVSVQKPRAKSSLRARKASRGPASVQSIRSASPRLNRTTTNSLVGTPGMGGVGPSAGSWISSTEIDGRTTIGFYNFSTAPLKNDPGVNSVHGYSYLMLDYNFSPTRLVSLRPAFSFDLTNARAEGGSNKSRFVWDDLFVSAIDTDLYRFANGTRLAGEMRIYAPTGDVSRNHGTVTRLRPRAELSHRFGANLELAATLEPEYYIQSRTSHLATDRKIRGNENYGYDGEVELRYRISRLFGAGVAVGHQQVWFHGSEANRVTATREENVRLETGVNFAAGPIFLVAGVLQQHNISKPARDLSFFDAEETQYYLTNAWRF